MRLTQAQLDQFHTEGWLLLPELFNAEEVDLLRREAIAIYENRGVTFTVERTGASVVARFRDPDANLLSLVQVK